MGNRPFKKKLRKHDLETVLETNNSNFSYLGNLPNEILRKIIDYLNIGDLLRCGQTCRRLRLAVCDNFLWKKVNLWNKSKVSVGLLRLILERGCEYLNIRDPIDSHLILNETNKLKCLNFAWRHEIRAVKKFCRNTDVLLTLLRSCTALEKLELYCVNFTPGHTFSIQGVKTLKILRLSYCKSGYKNNQPLELDFIKQIIDQCLELEELSFYKTRLSEDSIDYLVKNVTPKLSKLSLYTIIRDAIVMDKYIQLLVSRCTNLTELSLSGSGFTNNSVNYINENLQSTLEKLSLIRTSVSVTKLFELKAMKKLTLLSIVPQKNHIRTIQKDMRRFRRENPHMQSICNSKPGWSAAPWSGFLGISDDFSTFRSYK